MAGPATKAIMKWQDEYQRDFNTIIQESTIEMMEIANTSVFEGGLLPFDTGYLQSSIVGGALGTAGVIGRQGFKHGIRSAPINTTLCVGWEALYAKYQEFGTSRGISPRGFARNATAQWQQIVERQARKLNG